MRKTSILILCMGISFSLLAQKKELKKAEKFLKGSKFSEALNELKKAEFLVEETKFETQYYFLTGKAAFGDEKTNNYKLAVENFEKAIDLELESGLKKYSEKSINYINKINDDSFSEINKFIKEKDYKKVGDTYQMLYGAYSGRKDLLQNLLYARLESKEYAEAAKMTEIMLASLGENLYNAVDINTSLTCNFFNKADRDDSIKRGTHDSPSEEEVDKKDRLQNYNDLVLIYENLGDFEAQKEILIKAKQEFPNDPKINEYYAAVVYKSGDSEAYIKQIEKSIELTPDNDKLWFNLAIVSEDLENSDKAMAAYDKVIELNPSHRDAYLNKASLMLKDQKKLIKNLDKSRGTKKYKTIRNKIESLYTDAIPYVEKAYSLKKDDEGVKTLLKNLYNSSGQTSKAKAL